MSSAGAQTMQLEGGEPSSVASAAPVETWTGDGSTCYRIVYAAGNANMGSIYIPWSNFGYIGLGSANSIIVKVQS